MAVSASTFPGVQVARRFHFHMAVAFCATGFIGFAPTYWVPLIQGNLTVPPLLHLHAAIFYGWLLLYLSQTWLASSGQISRHREWGMAGIALASGMCFVGMAAALSSIRRSDLYSAAAGEASRRFAIVPFSGALLFAFLFALAVIYVKRPDIHKRLMLVNSAGLLQAAVGRWFALFLAPPEVLRGGVGAPPVAATVMPGLVVDFFIVAAMLHDRRHRGSVHPVYWFAGGLTLAVQVLRVPIAPTDTWLAIANWFLLFAP